MSYRKHPFFWTIYSVSIFLIIGFLLYGQTLHAYFLSDDWHWLYLASERIQVIPDFFANYEGTAVGGSYNPLTSLWFNSLYALFGLNSLAFHVGNIILHISNALLVALFIYLLLDGSYKRRGLAAFSSGILFLSWPTFVEVVAWVSSATHMLATFFYLLTLISYLYWRKHLSHRYLIGVLFFASCSLLSKEVAITLPFVVLVIEWLRYDTSHRKVSGFFYLFIPVIVFIALRYNATGLFFGTYAESTIVVRGTQVINTALTFIVDALTLGAGRIAWMEIYWGAPLVVGSLGVGIVIIGITALWKYAQSSGRMLLISFLISILPFLVLGFNRTSVEAERYTYLPGIFLVSLVAVLLLRLPRHVGKLSIIMLLVVTSSIVIQKSIHWAIAGDASRAIVEQYEDLPLAQRAVFVGMPDTISGAHVFRNNLQEAVYLLYPNRKESIEILPVYIQHAYYSYARDLVEWESDERGYFGKSRFSDFIVTGFDRQEVSVGVFELWNYDYTSFTSDTIRLILDDDAKRDQANGDLIIGTWNNGALRILPTIAP